MKPIFLEMQAFGPYITKQKIDFEELGKDGIFLIRGKTGSGKTTIFDAMTFALYGGSSGDAEKQRGGVGRNNLSEWRCRQAEDNVDTIVSFTFMEGGKKYNFKRSLVHKRTNFSEEYSAKLLLTDGSEKELFENPKKDDMNTKAEEIIGLSKEQFRQVVLLPQGQFERFIVAESGEKEQILNKLFNAEQWSAYAEKMYKTAQARVNALNEKKVRVVNSLREVSVRTDLIGEKRLTSVTTVADLDEYLKALAEGQEALKAEYEAFNVAEKRKQLEADKELARKFSELHVLEKNGQALEEQGPAYDIKRNEQKNATEVDYFRVPISEYETAKNALDDRKKAHNNLSESLPDFQNASKEAARKLEDFKNDSPVQANNNRIGALESKRESYRESDRLQDAADEAKKNYEQSERFLKTAAEKKESAISDAKEKLEKYNRANEEATQKRNRYFSGIYGELASELIEGTPCPVCGNTHHPDPAQKTEDSVTKDEWDEQEELAEEARQAWQKAEEVRANAENDYNNCLAQKGEKESEYRAALTAYENNKKSLEEGIEDLESLEKIIKSLYEANEQYTQSLKKREKQAEEASRKFEELKTRIETAKGEKEKAEEELNAKEKVLDKLMKEKGYSSIDEIKSKMMEPEDLKELTAEIAKYDEQCSGNKKAVVDAKEGLKGKPEPDASKFDERADEISGMEKIHSSKNTSFNEVIGNISGKKNDLSKLEQEYMDNIGEAESDLSFAKTLIGSSGLGLQRYVLAIMFDQVIGEANGMLSKVHGGRYQLFRSDDKGVGNKKGLELKVFDRWSPEDKVGRSVRMLSGGEKFLVSLSLSIGMSTIAQKAGMRIDSLFIDEGFGTLDETSINDAMEILESVRKDNGLIGIISHVKLLEENIPTQVEVIKTDKGNYIKVG